MCEYCYDCDKKQLMNSSECDGLELRHLTFFELQQELQEEWKNTGKQDYRIFQEAVIDLPKDQKDANWTYNNTSFQVKFVPFH